MTSSYTICDILQKNNHSPSNSNRSSSLFQKSFSTKSQQGKLTARSYSKDNQLSPRSKMMKFIPLIKTVQFLSSKIKKHQYFLWCRLESLSNTQKQNKNQNLAKYEITQKINEKNVQSNDNFKDKIQIKNKENSSVLYNSKHNLNQLSITANFDLSSKMNTNYNIQKDLDYSSSKIRNKNIAMNKFNDLLIKIQLKKDLLQRQGKQRAFEKFKKCSQFSKKFDKIQNFVNKNNNLKKLAIKMIRNYINSKIKAEILYNTLQNFTTCKIQRLNKEFIQQLKNNNFYNKKNKDFEVKACVSISVQNQYTINQKKLKQIQNQFKKMQDSVLVKQVCHETDNQQLITNSIQLKISKPLTISLFSAFNLNKKVANSKPFRLEDPPIQRNIFHQSNYQAMKKISHLYPQTPINQISDCFDSFSIFNTELKNNDIYKNLISQSKKSEQQIENAFNEIMITQQMQEYHQSESEKFNFAKVGQQQIKTVNSCTTIKFLEKKKKETIILGQKSKKCLKFNSSQKKKENSFKSSSSVQKYKFQTMKKSFSSRSIFENKKNKQQSKISININIPADLQKKKEDNINKDKQKILANSTCNSKSCSRGEWKSDRKAKYALFSCENKQNLDKGFSDQKTVRFNNKQLRNRQINIPCSQFIVEPIQSKISAQYNKTQRKQIQFQAKNTKKGKSTHEYTNINELRSFEQNVFNQGNEISSNRKLDIANNKPKTSLRSKLDKVQYNTAKKMKLQIQNIINQRKKSSIGIFKI